MYKFVRYLTILLFLFFKVTLFSQNSIVPIPPSFTKERLSMNVPSIRLTEVDKGILSKEDEENEKRGNPMRLAIFQPAYYNMNNAGRVDTFADGSLIWRINLHSPGALATTVHLTDLNIPQEAEIYIYDPSHTTILGKYSMQDSSFLTNDGDFLSQELLSEELILEYYEPANSSFKGSFTIANIGHFYRDNSAIMKGNHGNAEGKCHPDVVCQEGQGWQSQIDAVVFITITVTQGIHAGTYFCSGAMINNTRQDKTPYVLTADHCGTEGTVASFKFYFQYQANACKSTSGFAGYAVTGADIKARGNEKNSSDFMLLQIKGTIPEVVKNSLYFAGWDANNSRPTVGACIHHPKGDFKKISIPASSYNENRYPRMWGIRWKLGINNQGTTEGGSSGAPLFNANKRIAGQLYGGTSSCSDQNGADFYGKLSYSWNNNGTQDAAKKLKPWLDPDNTGKLVLDGIYYHDSVRIDTQEIVKPVLKIFPNPSNGNIKLSGEFKNNTVTCTITDLLGKVLLEEEVEVTTEIPLDFEFLQTGIYILKVEDGADVQSTKLVISK